MAEFEKKIESGELSYEEALEALSSVVKSLESGKVINGGEEKELTLDDSIKLYRTGKLLSDYCEKLLAEAQNQIKEINNG